MIYVLAGQSADQSVLNLKAIAQVANPKGVPILVDAAAEILTIPNVHLQNGAALVGYSGGKCLRGPQTAGLLLGRKDLVRAAWVHSAPHHGPGRAMKVGKEEAMGMLAAVETWVKRDHDGRMEAVDGVAGSHLAPRVDDRRRDDQRDAAGRDFPIARRRCASGGIPSASGFLARRSRERCSRREPRISLTAGRRPGPPVETGVDVTPYMMSPGDETIIADRLHAVLSSRTLRDPVVATAAPAAEPDRPLGRAHRVRGRLVDARAASQAAGNEIDGTHQGDFVARDLAGTISGSDVRLRSNYGGQTGDALSFAFTGKVIGRTDGGRARHGGVSLRRDVESEHSA